MKRPMTQGGYDTLRSELQKLRAMRPELAKAIEIARGHGDLSENGDYDAAKEKSGMVEARIRDIESRLAMAQIIDPLKLLKPSRVVFGSSVKIVSCDNDEERELCIVGEDESNVTQGLISCESPLGRSLIGKEVGDLVKVPLPGGSKEYEVTDLFINHELWRSRALTPSQNEV